MTAATGIEIESAGSAAPGVHGIAGSAQSSAPGAASFRSSWQSMMAALGAEIDAGDAAATQPGAAQKAATLSAPKNPQPALPTDSDANAAQVAIARLKLHPGAIPQREGDTADASLESAADSDGPSNASLEGSESPGKSLRHEGGRENGLDKKQSEMNSSTAQTAQLAVIVPVPLPQAAAPQLPQPANALAVHPAQSFLTGASISASGSSGHRTGTELTDGIIPSKAANNGIAAAVNGNSLANGPDEDAAAVAQSKNSGSETHGLFSPAHAQSGDPSASATGAGQADVKDGASASDGANGATNDSLSAGTDAANIASAATASSSAAHTLAAADRRIAEQATQRTAHGASDVVPTSPLGHAPSIQPIGTAGESSAMARDGLGGHVRTDTLPSGSSSSAPGARETFAALDADAVQGASWLHAGAHSAEAGFEDPALGWVSVRADLNAGAVHASVVPGTADAAQALGAHMAGLNAYLHEQRTPVGTVTLASPDTNPDLGQGAQQGSGQDSGSRDSSSRDLSGQQSAQQAGAQSSMAPRQDFAPAPQSGNDIAPFARSGTSISLIA
jgi:hypothetical protein